jgi:hypothetical protein
MAPGPLVPDSRYPANTAIPGRGLPASACAAIPSLQLRLVRACVLFLTSLSAAAILAIGPALAMAALGAGAPVALEPAAAPAESAADGQAGPAMTGRRLCRSPRNAVRARASIAIAAAGGAPGGRKGDGGISARRGPLSGADAVARRAGRRAPRCGCQDACWTFSLCSRPPPVSRVGKQPRRADPLTTVPATPPAWCAPVFSFPRV